MYREPVEPTEDRHHGYNLAFLRRVQAARRGLLTTPQEDIAPGPVQDEFKRGKIPKSESERQLRRVLAGKAAEIHEETAKLRANPEDISRTPVEIIKQVCERHGVTIFALRGKCRASFLSAVRHQAIVRVYLARPKASLPEIGRWFGLDHTTILHAVRRAGVYAPRLEGYRGKHRSLGLAALTEQEQTP